MGMPNSKHRNTITYCNRWAVVNLFNSGEWGMKKLIYRIMHSHVTNITTPMLSGLCIAVGVVAFSEGQDGLSLLRKYKAEDSNNWDVLCETSSSGNLNTGMLKQCLNLNSYDDAYVYMRILEWFSIIAFLIGTIGLILFFGQKRADLASRWIQTMLLYPIMFFIFTRVVNKTIDYTNSISIVTSLFSSIITGSGTIKLWDESWKYWNLLKEEKQQKLALYDASTLEFNMSMFVSVNKFDTPPDQYE